MVDWIGIGIVMGIILLGTSVLTYMLVEEQMDKIDRYRMYNTTTEMYTLNEVNGLYFSDGYYCVWTKDKTAEEIEKTDVHERCHALMDLKKEHFCYN